METKKVGEEGSSDPEEGIYIVYTSTPEGVDPETHHLRTLSSVLEGEDAAKKAIIYSYKTAASGFSAKLTKKQAQLMSENPDVLQVVPSRTLQLHKGETSDMALQSQ